MQVILLQDVRGVGRAGEVAKVSPGHGRNYLIPKGIAMEATPANLRVLEQRKNEIEAQRKLDEQRAEELKEQIEGKTISLTAKAGEGGRLFGAITSKDIADALEKDHGIIVDRKKIVLDAPIKETGITDVEIKLFPGVGAQCRIDVTAL